MTNIPTIAVFSKATTPLGVDIDKLIVALQTQVDRDFAPIWGTPEGAWAIVFLDNSDQAGALAYHDLTTDGLPISKVFVETTLANGSEVSVDASHELVEMLADPDCSLCVNSADGKTFYALETADPVEETWYPINGINVSNFVYPSYFESFHKPKSAQFDYLAKVTKPLQLLKGGYQSLYTKGKWTETFGSKAKAKRFAKEDRRGHRTELRGKKPIKTKRGAA